MDGVLFRNPKAMKIVEDKSTEFTKKYIPCFQPSKRWNYQMFGHTVKMINQLTHEKGKVMTTSLEDYNDYVFNDGTLRHVSQVLTLDDMVRADMWRHLIQKSGRVPHIFSNAPNVWVREVLSWISLTEMFENGVIVTPESLNTLKPSPESYETMIDKLHGYGIHRQDLLFMDDSKGNVEGSLKMGIPSLHYTQEIDDMLIHNFCRAPRTQTERKRW